MSWGYRGSEPEYVLDLLRPDIVKWVKLDPVNLDYDRIEISKFFPPSSYFKTDRNVMPSDQRIWGSGSAIYYDKYGGRAEAYVVVRQDRSDLDNTHLNIDLWALNADGKKICDSNHQYLPAKYHLLDDSKPVEIILRLDEKDPLKAEIPPLKTPTS